MHITKITLINCRCFLKVKSLSYVLYLQRHLQKVKLPIKYAEKSETTSLSLPYIYLALSLIPSLPSYNLSRCVVLCFL